MFELLLAPSWIALFWLVAIPVIAVAVVALLGLLLDQESIIKEFSEVIVVCLSFLILAVAGVAIMASFGISVYSVVAMIKVGIMINGFQSLLLFACYLIYSLIFFSLFTVRL